MLLTLLFLLVYANVTYSLQCFTMWPYDNTTYTTNLKYCQSALAVYERKQLSEEEIYEIHEPNICETTTEYTKMCAFMVARITDRGATNVLFCCCRSDFCNAFSMPEEYEERRELTPLCVDNRAVDSIMEKRAIYSPFCYQKLLFDNWSDGNEPTVGFYQLIDD